MSPKGITNVCTRAAHKVLVPGEPMQIMTKVGISKTVSSTTQ
jgi:hypothetical protein